MLLITHLPRRCPGAQEQNHSHNAEVRSLKQTHEATNALPTCGFNFRDLLWRDTVKAICVQVKGVGQGIEPFFIYASEFDHRPLDDLRGVAIIQQYLPEVFGHALVWAFELFRKRVNLSHS